MKTLTSILIMAFMCTTVVFAESAQPIHEISQVNIAEVREESIANFQASTTPNSGMTRVRETKGFWNKVLVIFENFMENANTIAEEERARQKNIQNHNSYRIAIR